jgi:hypothetical protein
MPGERFDSALAAYICGASGKLIRPAHEWMGFPFPQTPPFAGLSRPS